MTTRTTTTTTDRSSAGAPPSSPPAGTALPSPSAAVTDDTVTDAATGTGTESPPATAPAVPDKTEPAETAPAGTDTAETAPAGTDRAGTAPAETEAAGTGTLEADAGDEATSGGRRFRRAPRARRRGLAPGKRLPASRLIGPALFLALWAVASAAGQLDPGAIPAPWTVLRTTGHLWTDGTLPTDVLTSLERAGYGFAFGLTAGVLLALASGLSRVGEALIDGTVQLNRAIPTLGLIPLFILWLGIGETFKIAIIAIVVYIPIYLNLHSALSGIDHRFVELAEVQGLSRLRFVREIVIPGALPGFFVGLRLGVTGSWLSLVVLEQINATSGLGYMMFQAQNYGRTDIILVGLLIYGIFGLVSDSAVRLIERKVLSWRRTLSS
ncbi:ABC transporter permease subunit [Streptomyces sp. NPDC058398]|uniref:ABC transporter permease n=1 Tax=Streptomyces sp. NPDC058398 TaxID=3346479 RepID=UPI003650DC59